jgi:N-formylglutamate amidohydrolase
MTIMIGTDNGRGQHGTVGVFMVPMNMRTKTSEQLQKQIRDMLKDFAFANISVDRYQRGAGGAGTNNRTCSTSWATISISFRIIRKNSGSA